MTTKNSDGIPKLETLSSLAGKGDVLWTSDLVVRLNNLQVSKSHLAVERHAIDIRVRAIIPLVAALEQIIRAGNDLAYTRTYHAIARTLDRGAASRCERKSESKNKLETMWEIASNLPFFPSYKRLDDVTSAAQLSARYFVEDRCDYRRIPIIYIRTVALWRSGILAQSTKISREFLSVCLLRRNKRQRFVLEICPKFVSPHTEPYCVIRSNC